ncbi:MAG: FtsX-like permease family protein [Acidobacteria bacterium]|nr:MAG: FtsX-like permease family protein [Acidobacteriota bacterium]
MGIVLDATPDQRTRRSWPSARRFASGTTDFVRDLRFAILSLALGIGANTAIFSVVNALLLRPVPYADAGRLTILWNRSPGLGIAEDWFSTAQYFDIKGGHRGFEQLGLAIGATANLTGDGGPERVGVVRVSSSLLPMLGVTAARGRLFSAEDDAAGRAGTAVLTHGTWVRRYGENPRVVGRSITLNGQPFEVIGVLPASFSLPRDVLPLLYGGEVTEVFLPLPLSEAAPRTRTREDYNIIGKPRPGVSVAQAQAEMDTITARLRRDHPDVYPPNGGLTFSVVPLLEQAVGGVRPRLYVLMGAVAFVLLVACANVANLLLARALARRREFAVRAAFGAGRGRIARQALAESGLLALCGAALGVLLAYWSLRWIQAFGPKTIPRLAEVDIDWRVLAFTLAVALASGVVFGLAPALRLSRGNLANSLKEASRGATGAAFRHGHQALAVATVGTYGVMAYMVGQGSREIGIRIALGASRGRIVGLVLGQGAVLAGAGIGLGVGFAFVVSRFLASLLFGVSARDPLTFASIAALLLAVSLLAGYVPARRAARVAPVVSLRYE